MLKRLAIAVAQVKSGNNSESSLNEIRQIVYFLYQSKQITKKAYNNIIKSIKIEKMNTISNLSIYYTWKNKKLKQ